MKPTLLFFIIVVMTSCGILGIYSDSEPYITDSDIRAKILNDIDNSLIAKQMDSLLTKIDSAKTTIPNDLSYTTLIIETYNYQDFLRTLENKFNTPPNDSKSQRKSFDKYNKHKTRLLKNPKFKIIYADKGQYKNIDNRTAKYILKSSNRLHYTPNQLLVRKDSSVVPWMATTMFYIYDRENHTVFGEIKDLSLLEKRP